MCVCKETHVASGNREARESAHANPPQPTRHAADNDNSFHARAIYIYSIQKRNKDTGDRAPPVRHSGTKGKLLFKRSFASVKSYERGNIF